MSRAGGFHGPSRGAGQEKAKDFKGSIRNLIRYMGKYKLRLGLVLLCAIMGTVFSIVGPKILERRRRNCLTDSWQKYREPAASISERSDRFC